MSQDKERTLKRLDELWKDDKIQDLDISDKKYFIFSDLHLGDGGGADDFHENQETLEAALDFYKRNNFQLILLGDVEELWQFDLSEIVTRYNETIYRKIREFGDANVYRVFGNHDVDWRILPDPIRSEKPKIAGPPEALKIKDLNGEKRILLIHGHQGSVESDFHIWFSRFWVRAYRSIEPVLRFIGLARPPEAPRSRILDDYDKIFYSWAKENKVLIICGHSHRAVFGSKSHYERLTDEIDKRKEQITSNRTNEELVAELNKEIKKLSQDKKEEKQKKRALEPLDPRKKALPCYFNTGCCIYGSGITGIEIAEGEIRLVKWEKDSQLKPGLETYEKGDLNSYIKQVTE
jgi:UDP-2,3-diacylglucosamine pyrophosphatase LpxH